ncbi:MAG: exodeoxyribonuclease III [Xanthomonadales bacterium]|nr:Exodeoxyribonuclease [Xanthomonadales bacterium]MCC6593928.1 exodeoxyribonuclease III [Xanthomonadales bacterium]MCE7932065.1 exodeoxyribonuclease III [Xanthomonadales bacterium PRO6]
MRIITLNLNGLRAAARKGVLPWLAAQDADAIALQETRLQEPERAAEDFGIPGYTGYFLDAQAKGYSGVALYLPQRPQHFVTGIGLTEFDAEGRWLQADFGELSIISLYLPSGSSGEHRQAAKFRAMDALRVRLDALRSDGRRYIVCGDWNIAHRAIDLKNWRGNQKNSGFLPEERAWMEDLLVRDRWVDTHRQLRPDAAEYTWWSNRGQAWAKDVGWRIDYQIASPNLAGAARTVRVHRAERFSDHAPLIVDYELPRLRPPR